MFGKLNNEMKFYLLYFLVATLGGAVRKWFTDSSIVFRLAVWNHNSDDVVARFVAVKHYAPEPAQRFQSR